MYNGILVIGITMYCTSFLVYLYGALRASRSLHKTLVQSVLSATLRYVPVFRNFWPRFADDGPQLA